MVNFMRLILCHDCVHEEVKKFILAEYVIFGVLLNFVKRCM